MAFIDIPTHSMSSLIIYWSKRHTVLKMKNFLSLFPFWLFENFWTKRKQNKSKTLHTRYIHQHFSTNMIQGLVGWSTWNSSQASKNSSSWLPTWFWYWSWKSGLWKPNTIFWNALGEFAYPKGTISSSQWDMKKMVVVWHGILWSTPVVYKTF